MNTIRKVPTDRQAQEFVRKVAGLILWGEEMTDKQKEAFDFVDGDFFEYDGYHDDASDWFDDLVMEARRLRGEA